jgi:hypothetical protein
MCIVNNRQLLLDMKEINKCQWKKKLVLLTYKKIPEKILKTTIYRL